MPVVTIFYLFHRPRKWNPSEKLWMGHERKRGKLSDLNALIKGKGFDRFSLIIGNTDGFVAGEVCNHSRCGYAATA